MATLCCVAAVAASAATSSNSIRSGIFDDAQVLFGDPQQLFPLLKQAKTEMLRVNLWWFGPNISVAKRRPANATNPDDSAYDWETYDRTVRYATQYSVRPVFSIIGTPPWANKAKGWNVKPDSPGDLQAFATAAARRYSGSWAGPDGNILPRVEFWIAWNEPNNPVFLKPQYGRPNGEWRIQSGPDYAEICNAVADGVHSVKPRPKVACGVTGPRGNNNPNTIRASVSPLAFLRSMQAGGARGFDAIAHHPYYGTKSETPSAPPPRASRGQAPTAVTLGNINVLIKEVDRLFGRKRIWITEYGYQTNPPDTNVGVTYKQQAAYLTEAYRIVQAHPRIDMFLWFLLRDEVRPDGWQSGLITVDGKKKPAFKAFANMHG